MVFLALLCLRSSFWEALEFCSFSCSCCSEASSSVLSTLSKRQGRNSPLPPGPQAGQGREWHLVAYS